MHEFGFSCWDCRLAGILRLRRGFRHSYAKNNQRRVSLVLQRSWSLNTDGTMLSRFLARQQFPALIAGFFDQKPHLGMRWFQIDRDTETAQCV